MASNLFVDSSSHATIAIAIARAQPAGEPSPRCQVVSWIGFQVKSEFAMAEAPGGELHVRSTHKPQLGTSRARSRYVELFTFYRTWSLISLVMRILGWSRNDAQPLKERTALQLRRSLSGARCALRTRPVFSAPLPRERKLLHQTYSAYCFRFLGARYGATCCWGSVLAGPEFHLC